MNKHQNFKKLFDLNRGKTSIHSFSSSSPTMVIYSRLICLVDKKCRYGTMIAQISCQSNSMWRVNCTHSLCLSSIWKPDVSVESGRRNYSLQYLEFGPQYPFKPLAANLTYCTETVENLA